MGFREFNDWPEFSWESKRYLCLCQIDNQPKFALSGHRYVTHAHYTMGNLGRHWKALGGKAHETGVNHHNKCIWNLAIDGNEVKVTVGYIDLDAEPPVSIDETPIGHEPGCSKQSEGLLAIIKSKL